MTAGEPRDQLARVIRAREAIEDGEPDLAAQLLADLEHDIRDDLRRREEPPA